MKKLLLLFNLLAFALLSVHAQTPWYTDGNGGTSSSNFIGTTEEQPLIFKTNGNERMQLLPNKSFLGIGVPTPQATLHLHYHAGMGDASLNLLQLTTSTSPNGFCIFSDKNTRDILFQQREDAKFFIEGPAGGLVIAHDGNLGIGTDDPAEQVHVVGKLLIERTAEIESGLLFKHPITRGEQPHDTLENHEIPYHWDIFSDVKGLKFNTVNDQGAFAQRIVFTKSGFVGIGVTAPRARLDVGGSFKAASAEIEGELNAQSANLTGMLNAQGATLSNGLTVNNGSQTAPALIDKLYVRNGGYVKLNSLTTESATIENRLTVNELRADTATISGLTTVKDIRVENLLCAKEAKVQPATCWPDYVFSKNYNLLPLREVEQFINNNHHLPDIPSATEVEAHGIELGEMNAKLLQKVEELTLYIIDLQNQINELKTQKP